MTDAFHVPNEGNADIQIFQTQGGSAYEGYQTWIKPRGCNMTMMVAVAGGGGGGGGFGNTDGNARGGGAGGACSGITRFLVSTIFLPDQLYVSVGRGGVGGAGSTGAAAAGAGTAGLNSFISSSNLLSTIPLIPNIILASGINTPGGGANGTAAGAAIGGTIPSIAVVQPIHSAGFWSATVGIVGGAGAALGSNGANISPWAALPMSPGNGAGGITTTVSTAGGAQSPSNQLYCGAQLNAPSSFILGGAVAGPIDGSAGLMRVTPFYNTGGTSGASIAGGQGGNGGNGGYGCGGGGGGGGTTGGRGGDGGPGLVFIISW